MAAERAQPQQLTPAERRDRATARLGEIQGKLAEVDQQIKAHDATQRSLDAKVAAAQAAVYKQRGTLAGTVSGLKRATAAHLVAQGSDGESTAAEKVAEAEASRQVAQAALSEADGALEVAKAEAAQQGDASQATRSDLQSQRDELASLADALKVHRDESDREAGDLEASELVAEILTAERAVAQAEAQAAAARAALMAKRQSIPQRLAAWPGLSSRDDVIVHRDTGLARAELVVQALLAYMRTLQECAGATSPTVGQRSVRLATHALDERSVDLVLSPAGEMYRALLDPKIRFAEETLATIAALKKAPHEVRGDLIKQGVKDVVPTVSGKSVA